MNAPANITAEPLAKLREPFPAHQISKLPKPLAKREVMDSIPKAKCRECGGYHATDKIIHLDYVGHAALTDRLLDTDPMWTWEPVGFTAEGLPALDRNGGLWIKLTVCGVTRYGYGAADGKSGGDAMKEMIGDALRNAAMRFGAALDLWHKGDLHVEDEPEPAKPKAKVVMDGVEPSGSHEPEKGWAAWATDLTAQLANATKPGEVEIIRQREDANIRNVGAADKAIYRAIGKAFNTARDRFANTKEKEPA